jgi:hypothetical protein
MNLLDGLNSYKQDSAFWKFTLDIENSANEVLKLVALYGDRPNSSALAAAHALLEDIELWKAGCLKDLTGYAVQNSEQAVWNAFRDAMNARTDPDALRSIMQLTGFGKYPNEEFGGLRPAKRATAVLRMLKPDEWGVVDWRTAAMLGHLNESNWDVDQAMALAKKENADDLRETFQMINEDGACAYNQMYRYKRPTPFFSRTADVEMAVFGLSLMAWPMP